jgi:hypothetical protein
MEHAPHLEQHMHQLQHTQAAALNQVLFADHKNCQMPQKLHASG